MSRSLLGALPETMRIMRAHLRPISLELALFGRAAAIFRCPLFGVQQTQSGPRPQVAFLT
jgi:hypothetical protein